MNRLKYIVKKEFIQILKNKAILPLMTVVPIIQLIVLSFAANNEVKNVRLAVIDQDPSSFSRLLTKKIEASGRFILLDVPPSVKVADRMMQKGEVDIILTIPPQFQSQMWKGQSPKLQLLINAINGQQATVGSAYLTSIIRSFNLEIRHELTKVYMESSISPPLSVQISNWYNPDLDYKDFMVPGILGELVTVLVMLLTAMNVVREREIGTIEQINVTPIKKWEFILGKMIPFLVIGLILLTVGMAAGKLIFDIPMRGNLWVVFSFCILNLIAVLGLGLFISNLSNTQQQAMFVTFFFAITFILMSGLFTPIESMPKEAQILTIPNPIAHFVHVMRSVLIKGSGFEDIKFSFQATAVLAVVFNALAIWSYRKVQ